MSDSGKGRTIRDAVALALEVIPGSARSAMSLPRAVLREHVVGWVLDYATRRGVILNASDVTSELDAIVAELRD